MHLAYKNTLGDTGLETSEVKTWKGNLFGHKFNKTMKFEFEYFSYTVYLGCISICCVMFVFLYVLNYFNKCGI